MKTSSIYLILFLIILILAGAFRLVSLDLRPMHTDEAVHAIKFGALLEKGEYRYDKNEYHGPSLNYFTLVIAYLKGKHNLTETDEYTLRSIPAIIGLCIILIPLWLFERKTWNIVLPVALLLAISPVMVFYSRYYIMEILLVFFTYGFIASCYRYLQSQKTYLAVSAGFFLGLMHATKETWVISFAAMVMAILIMFYFNKKGRELVAKLRSVRLKHVILTLTIAILISVTLFSSFFTNPQGIIDSLTTYSVYINRAGQNNIHVHPWNYYLKLLTWNTGPGNIIWSELLIVFLAAFGFIGLLREKAREEKFYWLVLFIGLYSLILSLIYSFLPYKTPWNLLQFYCGFIILAGYGLSLIWRIKTGIKGKVVTTLFITGGILHLIWQSWAGSFSYYADPNNPYVYGHTSNDIKMVSESIDRLASIHPDGKDMFIEVIFPGSDYWPLPWYLREYPNIGWWDKVDLNVPLAINIPYIAVSCKTKQNIEPLKKKIIQETGLIRIYSKDPMKKPSEKPIILERNSTIEDVCKKIRRDFTARFLFAKVWGTRVKFPGQQVGLSHRLEDKDIVEIHLK